MSFFLILFGLYIPHRKHIFKDSRKTESQWHLVTVRKLNRPLLGFLTMNSGKEEPHMVRTVAE